VEVFLLLGHAATLNASRLSRVPTLKPNVFPPPLIMIKDDLFQQSLAGLPKPPRGGCVMAEASQKTPAKSEEKAIERAPAEGSPLLNLRREFDRMLDEFPWGWRRPLARSLFDVEPFFRGFGSVGATPAVDIAEKDKEYEITAELPGMDESNIDVKFADGMLTIKGEKKEEKEEKKKDYYLSERRYGSFQRSFQVPDSVDANKIKAKFVNGVLTVKLPKSVDAQKNEKRIAINKG
jgi:HSP20 family protein